MSCNQLFKTRTFFEGIHCMCKQCQIVVLHIILENVHNLSHYGKTLFVHICICPLPCRPFFCFVNYPFPFCSPCFDFEQMLEGFSLYYLLDIPTVFLVILQILSSMLVIKVYLIIGSNVFLVWQLATIFFLPL